MAILRENPGSTGAILFSFKALQANKRQITDELARGPYRRPALVPLTPWLGTEAPPGPKAVEVSRVAGGKNSEVVLTADAPYPFLWAVRHQIGETWTFSVHPGANLKLPLDDMAGPAGAVAVSGVDRLGNASEPALWTRSPSSP